MFATVRAFQELKGEMAPTTCLYGPAAAAMYEKAAKQNAKAKEAYYSAMDSYYKANQAADYDAHVDAQRQWSHFDNIPSDSSDVWGHLN